MPRGSKGEMQRAALQPFRVHVVGKDDSDSTSKKQAVTAARASD